MPDGEHPVEPTQPELPVEPPAAAAAGGHGGRRRIGLAALAIMVIHFLARIGGFIQKKVLAHFFGAGPKADAATGMQRIFEMFFYTIEELLSHTVLPVFSRVRDDEGEEAAWHVASLVGTLLGLLLVVMSLVGWFGASWIVGLTYKGFLAEPAKFELTVRLVKVSMLGLLVTCLSSLTYVLLNADKRFVTPALGDVAQKVGIVAATVVVCVGFSELGPLGVALGFVLGGIFKLLTHVIALRSKVRLVRPSLRFDHPAMRELGVLTVPLLAGTLVGKIRDLWEQRLASQIRVEGTVASLDYARKIIWMPVSIVPYALGKALFPFLADWAHAQDRSRLTEAFLGASRMMIFIFLPMTVATVLLNREVITFLYVSGQFDAQAAELTAAPFLIYGLGLVFYALEIIALQVYYAYRDTRTPFYNGVVGSSIHILVAWLAGLVLGLNNAGIALGFAVAKLAKTVLLWWQLRGRVSEFRLPALANMTVRTALASAVMAAWILVAKHVAPAYLDLSHAKPAALFLLVVSAGAAILFFAASALLRIEELDALLRVMLNRLRRRAA